MTTTFRRRAIHTRRVVALASSVAVLATVVGGGVASADTTVYYDDAGSAPRIGLLGDSMLSGVRWYDDYGDLRRFNFVFDAESCRRTLEGSCWSREGYRPENGIGALDRLDGEWGDVLVVTTGYNDSSSGFVDAVDAVVGEALEQGIPHVVWLTMRTAEVSYEEPLHLANGNTYRESNRALFEKVAEYDGYLQLADWATYSADNDEWFEYDGVHLTEEGVDAVTSYIADTAETVLAGTTVTPEVLPWATLADGNWGDSVVDAQQALVDAGIDTVGDVDGIYGSLTETAVRVFQTGRGLEVTGLVDEPTAIALGLYDPPRDVFADEMRTQVPSPASSLPRETATVEAAAAEPTPDAIASTSSSSWSTVVQVLVLVALVALVALAAWVIRRRRRPSVIEVTPRDDEQARPPIAAAPTLYDYERDDVLIG